MNWTEDRCKDLDDLDQLLRECGGINSGSHVIERLQRITALADKLSRTRWEPLHVHFVGFLREIADAERMAERAAQERA